MGLNAMDLCAIQECMVAYKKMIEWLPTVDEVEQEMKRDRIDVINHIVKICGNELNILSEVYRNEDV